MTKTKNKTYFAHRIDRWDHAGENLIEHLAGVDDFDLAIATYRAACLRWPQAKLTLRQGARVMLKSWGELAADGHNRK